MLRDVAVSIAAWLVDYLPPGTDVVFDLPSGRTDGTAALALFLHDVREEGEVTPADMSQLRNDEGRLIGRLPPQRRYRLTYLMTAWAKDPLDEHELLGGVLAGCATQQVIPPAALRGCLVEMGQAIMVRCAPEERGCDPRELWAAWRIPPRTALELSVLAPIPVSLLTNIPQPPSKVDLSSTRPPDGARRFGPRDDGIAGRRQARILE